MEIENLKVLLCDDSVLSRKNLRNDLKNAGCGEILEALDGEAVVGMYKDNHPDIVFMDIVMPKKDGITAAREIKEYDPKAHIVMVSSVGTQAHLREAMKAGAADFLQKPTTPDQIKAALQHFCTLGGV